METAIATLREWFATSVRSTDPDLTARQTAVLLTICSIDTQHTVRGMAKHLNISKPAVTRAMMRLETERLAQRTVDPLDRRSVDLVPQPRGIALCKRMAANLRHAETATAPAADQEAR